MLALEASGDTRAFGPHWGASLADWQAPGAERDPISKHKVESDRGHTIDLWPPGVYADMCTHLHIPCTHVCTHTLLKQSMSNHTYKMHGLRCIASLPWGLELQGLPCGMGTLKQFSRGCLPQRVCTSCLENNCEQAWAVTITPVNTHAIPVLDS